MLCGSNLRTSIMCFIILLIFPSDYLLAEESVCARVKIEIKQEMTFERQAFEAHMQISNGLTTISLGSIFVDVLFSNERGEPVRASSNPDDPDALFFIRVDSMAGIDDVAGSGTIAPATTGDIRWLIIPAPASVEGAPAGALYFVGARLTYELGGEEHLTEVTPDFITVRPLPLLSLDYFLPDEVYGDDPFTIEEEPSIPFSLGVRISNNGHGTASDVKIDSAQPRIIDNEQGLAVDFLIEGSEVNGITATDTLLIQFGDIAPETSTIGRWLMSCPLSGRFTEFKAEYSHSNELGGELTSLLEDIQTHFLVQDVLVDAPGRDTVRDFLGRNMDQFKVYESDAGITEVAELSAETRVAAISDSAGIAQYSVEVAPTAGFFYFQFPDPQGGERVISEILRSDGKRVKKENGWLSKKRVDSNWSFHANIFDFNSSGSYLLTLIDPALAPQPPVFEQQENPVQKEGEEVSFIISLVDDSEPQAAGFKMLSVATMAVQPALAEAAGDCDGKTEIRSGRLPVGARLIDRCDGTAILVWTPQEGQAGDYPLTFTASDGEFTTTVRYHLTITDAANIPTAKFSADPTSGEAPFTVLFIDESFSKDGISSWLWDFGDGTTSTDQVPTHTYTAAGIYTVSLTVTERDKDQHMTAVSDYITVENDRIPVQSGHIAASSEWRTINLTGSFKDPVIVATFTGDAASSGRYTPRVRAVSPTEFQVRVEPDEVLAKQLPAEQIAGDISYIAAESGDHILQDGSVLYARHLRVPADGGELTHTFATPFAQLPVIVATVAGDNVLGAVSPSLSHITTESFQLRLQSAEVGSPADGTESVDCIAWEPGMGLIEGTVFEVGYLEELDERWGRYLFAETFAGRPSFVAAQQDQEDTASGGPLFRALDALGVEARSGQFLSDADDDEPAPLSVGFIAVSSLSDTADSDGDGITDLEERLVYGTHPSKPDSDLDGAGDGEELVYWDARWNQDADGDTVINLLDMDADDDGFRDGLEMLHGFDPADGDDLPAGPIMEIGRVLASGNWQKVRLDSHYLDPVVVATVTETSEDRSNVRIRNSTSDSFEVRTTAESEENVSYIVMERSSYSLADGTLIIAGTAGAAPAEKSVRYDFSDGFVVPPVVMVSVTSVNGPEPAAVVLDRVEKDNFVYSLQTDTSLNTSAVSERIDFIAWEPSAGVTGEFAFETGYLDHVNQWWQRYQFSSPLYGIQSFVAILQETPEERQRQLLFRNLDWSGIEARFARSGRERFRHGQAGNGVGFIALSFMPPGLDSDGDGLTEREEVHIYGTDPSLADSDGDGLGDGDEAERWGDGWNGDFDHDGLVNILDPDSDNDGYNDGLEFIHGFDPADPLDSPDGPVMGFGDLHVDSEWQRVTFSRAYLDPVVVALARADAFSRAAVRVKNVGPSGFEVRHVPQGEPIPESTAVSYIVMERGAYTLPGGEKVIAEHSAQGAGHMYARHMFSIPFASPPVVIASMVDGGESVPASVCLLSINPFMFYSGLSDFSGYTYLNSPAGVDYIAWQASAGQTGGIDFSVNRFEKVKSRWKTFLFDRYFPVPPGLMVMNQGVDQFPPDVVLARNISETDVEMRVKPSFESSKASTKLREEIGVIAIGG